MKGLRKVFDNEQLSIDMNPLLNILLILLLFFVVIGSLNKNDGIELQQSVVHPNHNPDTIVIRVAEDGLIKIQDRFVTLNRVTPTLSQLRDINPDAPVSVKVNSIAKTKYLVGVLDEIRAADVDLPRTLMGSGL